MLVAVVNLDIVLEVPRPIALEKSLWDKYLDIIATHDLEFSNEYSVGSLIVLRHASQKIRGMAKGSISSSMGRARTIADDLAFTLRQEKLPYILDLIMSGEQNNGLHINNQRSKTDSDAHFPIYRSVGYYSHKSSSDTSIQYAHLTLNTYQLLESITSGGNVEYFKEIEENYFYHTLREPNQKQHMDVFIAQKLLSN